MSFIVGEYKIRPYDSMNDGSLRASPMQ
jgi:hypothetical protein